MFVLLLALQCNKGKTSKKQQLLRRGVKKQPNRLLTKLNPSVTHVPAVVAYGELVFSQSTEGWQEFTIKLEYNATNIVPTHLVLVCSASRYGDYFTGSRDSKMWVDDFELIYDE